MTITTQGTWPLSNRDSNAYWSLLPDSLAQEENEPLHSFARPPATIEWENQRRKGTWERMKEEQSVSVLCFLSDWDRKGPQPARGRVTETGVSLFPSYRAQ